MSANSPINQIMNTWLTKQTNYEHLTHQANKQTNYEQYFLLIKQPESNKTKSNQNKLNKTKLNETKPRQIEK